ncbi:hypothetical protein KEM55_000878 [Ascosphaera atra]|nr:hypothetical protein KEM55_000878 [Ascosphaera atra]
MTISLPKRQRDSFPEHDYPWNKHPLIASAPMLKIAGPELAVAVSNSGGLGFIAAGYDVSNLSSDLAKARSLLRTGKGSALPTSEQNDILPIGIGFINWGADLEKSVDIVRKFVPAAVWFFAPPSQPPSQKTSTLKRWTCAMRGATQGRTKVWVQVGTVGEALEYAREFAPDVFVAQGQDAGGHGLARSAGVISLVPEMVDALQAAGYGGIAIIAAGGIVDGRGVAAAVCLGAQGCAMGTRYLCSNEARVMAGYQRELINATDGGKSTRRSTVYDKARGVYDWPPEYEGRGLLNRTYFDAISGVPEETVRRMYADQERTARQSSKQHTPSTDGYGSEGRLVTYCGTGVGLLDKVQPAAEITESTRLMAQEILAIQGKQTAKL